MEGPAIRVTQSEARVNIAFCYENVDPARGGCETYIADLARRMVRDGHAVHLYACRWNAAALPNGIICHPIARQGGPRFLRPWRFGRACLKALAANRHDVSIGFDKTWGQDIHYPQGGVYAASQAANLRKHASPWRRTMVRLLKQLDPAVQSFRALERLQLSRAKAVIVNSRMARGHAADHLGLDPHRVDVLHAAIDPGRFDVADRERIRDTMRRSWDVPDNAPVGVFVAMNYRLKGLDPLVRSVALLPRESRFRLVVAGHPQSGAYQQLARRLGVADRVIFHGYCGDSRQVYFAGDFLIHPTFYDPCSLVVLEALACGLPIITSRSNGAAELMDPPHDGLVIDDPHDHARLAAAIARMIDDDYRSACVSRARHSATLWTFDDHYRKMMAILEDVAARKRLAAPMPSAA
jgi:UDP-glucose:(heptosyl)LPS alpha-1,3-glucosyltransferase